MHVYQFKTQWVQRWLWTGLFLLILTPGLIGCQQNEADSGEVDHQIRSLPEPMGFAFADDRETTGGEGGEEVLATTGEELLEYATRDEPYIISVADTIDIIRGIGDFKETRGEYYIGSNTTIRGVTPNATIQYGGFRISEVENVIIQNLNFDGTFSGFDPELEDVDCEEIPEGRHRYKNGRCLEPGDRAPSDNALEVRDNSENVWITQNSFKRYSDEIMSVKTQASFVTISWNRFDDRGTGKDGMMILIGSSDNTTADRGRLKTTLHHNYMAARTRHPRTRFGEFHILNNYYHNVDHGIQSTMGAEILAEANYFENVNHPWHIGYGDSDDGYLINKDNIFIETDIPEAKGELGSDVTSPGEYYDYSVDDPEEIPALILQYAGAGR